MSILNNYSNHFKSNFNYNHDGGELSSDCGLLLALDFHNRMNLIPRLQKISIVDERKFHVYSNAHLMHQVLLQLTAGYDADSSANMLQTDPFFDQLNERVGFASQPSVSRLWNRFTSDTLSDMNDLSLDLFDIIRKERNIDAIILDVDSTHCDTYGKQENTSYNGHYKTVGYHPIVAIDAVTGMVMNAKLRTGSTYTSSGTVDFVEPIFKRYSPDNAMIFRADSGSASPEIYECCERYNVNYLIRLKRNNIVNHMANEYVQNHSETTGSIEPESLYYFISYQAKSWEMARTVAVHSYKQEGQLFFNHEFVITNFNAFEPKLIFKMYRNRGIMENSIKELKLGFYFDKTDSSSFLENAARMTMSALAYNLFQMMKKMCFGQEAQALSVDTVRLRLFKIAGRVVKHARRTTIKLSSSHVYQKLFKRISDTILNMQLII